MSLYNSLSERVNLLLRAALLTGAVLGTCYSAEAQAAEYILASLGNLGWSEAWAYGINNAGQVVGYSKAVFGGNELPFVWTQTGGMWQMTLPTNYIAGKAYGVNEKGVIVGQIYRGTSGYNYSFFAPDGLTCQYLPVYLGAPDYARAINEAGWVAGYTSTFGYVKQMGTPYGSAYQTRIPTLGGPASSAYDLTNVKTWIDGATQVMQVAGEAQNSSGNWRAYRCTIRVSDQQVLEMIDLGTLGGTSSWGSAINNWGEVTGQAYTSAPGQRYHAFLWSDASGTPQMTDLGYITDPNYDSAAGVYYNSKSFGMNSHSVVVGQSEIGSIYDLHVYYAFVWDQVHGIRDLNKLVDHTSGEWVTGGWTKLDYAMAVNDNGWIVGKGVKNGNAAAFLLLPANACPTAEAGADITANEATLVTLVGSGTDPDGDTLTPAWTQVAGPAVSLDLTNPWQPRFLSPQVARGGQVLTFQLVVNDGKCDSASDVVNVTIANANHLPVADAGSDQAVAEGAPSALDGSSSYDPDDDLITYAWVQTGGPQVTLSDPTAARPTFTAPYLDAGGSQASVQLAFSLTVNDGLDSSLPDEVVITVENVNHAPVANAGPDATWAELSVITLDGTASSDPDSDPLTYAWTQISGQAVTLLEAGGPTPSFSAPLVGPGGEDLVFQLDVADGYGGQASDQVSIHVQSKYDPPACNLASASPAVLWPPNHKLVRVDIVNVADPNNAQVTIAVTAITQDEPANGMGDGDTNADAAILGGAHVFLRAERSGVGNGRVYTVYFNATDSYGESCTGSVKVMVPQDRKAAAVDSGQAYDSLQP